MSNPLWSVIQAYMDDPSHRYPPKPADLARETGVSEQVLSKWKGRATLPTPAQLARVAKGTGIRYERLLGAALAGRYYLPADEGVDLRVFAGEQVIQMTTEMLDLLIRLDIGAPITRAHLRTVKRELKVVDNENSGTALSVDPDSVGDLVAADEQDQSISGEQEESETP